MKTKLQKQLAKIAPQISIATHWSLDLDPRGGYDESEEGDWQAWQSNVCCTAIVNGDEIEGNAYLGSTWETAGDNPETSNPEISGYENQMTVEALEEMAGQTTDLLICNQVIAAIRHCEAQA